MNSDTCSIRPAVLRESVLRQAQELGGRGGENNPTLFVYGEVSNSSGIFRSDDMGTSWTQIDIPNPAIGDDPNTMVSDMQQYGRLYIGTNGRGIYVGEPLEPLRVELADFSATQTSAHYDAGEDVYGVGTEEKCKV